MPLDQATAQLKQAIKDFLDVEKPGVKVIEAEAGLGKTFWALYWMGVETRYAENTNGIFLTDLYVPNHNLSAQIEADARAQGMSAFTEFGRGQELTGRPVCTKAEAISKVQGIIPETRKAFCGNDEATCADRQVCLWWEIHDKSLTHDLRIRTHAHLPLQIAKEHGRTRVPNAVVIDENFLGALIKQSYLDFKDLCDVTRHDMGEWMLKLAQVVKEGMTLERLEAAGFTVDVCKALIKAENDLAPMVEINRDTRPHLIGGHGNYVWEAGSFNDAPATNFETWLIRGGSSGAAMYTFEQPGVYAYVNHNLIEAVLLGATAYFVVEGDWNNALMEQVVAPRTFET